MSYPGTKPVCYAERLKIKRLVDEKKTRKEIAQALGRSQNCINAELRRCASFEEYDAVEAQAHANNIKSNRNNSLRRFFSDSEEALIESMASKGASKSEIRDVLKCGWPPLDAFLNSKGLHVRADGLRDLPSEIDLLKMQVEILTEQLKGIYEFYIKDQRL